MAEDKPRIFQGMKDVSMSLLLILVLMIAAVAFTGMCSFTRGAPENGPIQKVDAATFFNMEAKSMPFPVRLPETPEGWTTNSARRSTVDGKPAPIVGWVTKDGAYMQLLQTDQPLKNAVKDADEHVRDEAGTRTVEGVNFEIFTTDERNARDIWAADLGDVRLILSGTAADKEFEQIAANSVKAQPIAKG